MSGFTGLTPEFWYSFAVFRHAPRRRIHQRARSGPVSEFH